MKRIFQNRTQRSEEKAKKSTKPNKQSLDIANLQRAIEDPTSENLSPETMMALQQTHGNQFTAQLTGGTSYPIQAKLTVTEANDSYEQEADAVAKDVVAGMNAPVQRVGDEEDEMMLKRDNIQRLVNDDEQQRNAAAADENAPAPENAPAADENARPENAAPDNDAAANDGRPEAANVPEEEEVPAQRKAIQTKAEDIMGGQDVSSEIEGQIEQQRGGGQALPDKVRSGLETGFGADFSNVRVHTDSNADNLSRSIQAQAFTTGSDIFFKQGSYDPNSSAGQELLAHELTHTIQQGASPKAEDANE